jgi:hypothetical protein
VRDNRIIDLHRAREIILDMVANDGADFSMTLNEKHRDEFVDVRVEYAICGVHYAKSDCTLKLILNINRMSPPEVDVNYDRFHDALMQDIPRNLPFLVKDTYSISFDINSIRDVNRQSTLGQFREELGMAIEMHELSMDDALPLLLDYIEASLKESSYDSIEDMREKKAKPRKANRPVLEISPPGVPCPHCSGHLSEEALHNLMTKFYIRHRSRDRRDF